MKNIIIIFLLLIIVFMTIGDRNNTDTLYVKSYTTPAETVPIPILTSTPDTLHNPSINVSHSSKTCFAKKANNSRVFVSTPIPTPKPTPVQIYSYDNIPLAHKIELCKPTPTVIYEQTGGDWYVDCGRNSGIISYSEMVLVKVTIINGDISLIPWETETVNMRWYDGSNNRCSILLQMQIHLTMS